IEHRRVTPMSNLTQHAIGAAAAIVIAGLGSTQNLDAQGSNMNVERNKAVARIWSEELWSKGNLSVAQEIISPDYVRHDPGDPFPARGPEDVQKIVTMLRGMLPDLKIQIDAMVAEGDFVVSHYTSTATDTRGYMGNPPTGKTIRTSAMQMFRFADG